MSEAISIVMAQIAQLAAVGGVTTSREEVMQPQSCGSLLTQAASLSGKVDHSSLERRTGPPGADGALISDLFAFLPGLPDKLRRRIETDDPSSEPPRAWNERTAGPYWQFASLIQDVWEHTFGPETADDPGILELLRKLNLRDVCDIGAGAGFFAFQLARMGAQVACLETNPVKQAFLRFRRNRRPEGRFVSLHPGKRAFEAVLAINVLDHLRRPIHAVRTIASRIRVGGLLICCAGFPDDGWHRGGERIRETVFRELMRHFRYPEAAQESFDSSLVLVRRRRSAKVSARRLAPGSRYRLHPAAMLSPIPGGSEQFVLSAPRFYVRPLLLSQAAAEITHLWRQSNTWTGLIRSAKESGGTPLEIHAALRSMFDAHLLVPVGRSRL